MDGPIGQRLYARLPGRVSIQLLIVCFLQYFILFCSFSVFKCNFSSVSCSQIRKLKECFNSLDDDGSGSIGVDEIKGPLIGLGLVDTVEEVENLVNLVDEDGSGMIEFGEFLDIILNKSGDAKARVITDFFKNLTNGQYNTNGLAFPNWVLKE